MNLQKRIGEVAVHELMMFAQNHDYRRIVDEYRSMGKLGAYYGVGADSGTTKISIQSCIYENWEGSNEES